jgi:hypothetical protein
MIPLIERMIDTMRRQSFYSFFSDLTLAVGVVIRHRNQPLCKCGQAWNRTWRNGIAIPSPSQLGSEFSRLPSR